MVNLGGGFPTKYLKQVPGTGAYANAIHEALTKHFGNALPETIIEPGRGMVGNAGVVKAEVVLISRKHANDNTRWVYLDIGKFGGLAETMDEAIRYPITTARDDDAREPCVIAGPTCDSADVLYEKTPYPLPVPVRLLDTRTAGGRARVLRTSSGAWDSTFRLKSGAWIDVEAVVVTGEYETPGAWVNIVSVSSQANGNLAVYPPGAYPGTSTLNFTKGVTLANGAFVGTGIVAGRYAIRIRASKPTHVVLDLTGLVIKGTAPTPTARLSPPAPATPAPASRDPRPRDRSPHRPSYHGMKRAAPSGRLPYHGMKRGAERHCLGQRPRSAAALDASGSGLGDDLTHLGGKLVRGEHALGVQVGEHAEQDLLVGRRPRPGGGAVRGRRRSHGGRIPGRHRGRRHGRGRHRSRRRDGSRRGDRARSRR